MTIRLLALISAIAMAIISPPAAVSQTAGAKDTAVTGAWRPPMTPDGHPDLQGVWMNKSATPLERPAQLKDRQFLTDAEVAELRRRADRIFKDGHSDYAPGDDVFLAALSDIEQYKNPNATETSSDELIELKEFDNRTSLIVDPPDGRIPPYTPAGLKRRDAGLVATAARNPKGPEDLAPFQRCITWGIPMLRSGPYTSYYQIVQAPGYVVVATEAIHEARIVPLDGRPHHPQNVRGWNGDSVGHWEGETLVVDTTNFSPKANFMGSAADLHLIERFTRVAPDEIRYEITIMDLTTWTKPWTAALRLKQSQDRIYEFACHEGNFPIMEDMLSTASGKETVVGDAPAKRLK